MGFVHLHNHSDYSILDGAASVKNLVRKTVELEMPAIALTDHGNMYGVMEFYLTAKKAGIKPIIGCEAYIAPGSRHERGVKKRPDAPRTRNYFHLVLLAKNLTGYRNLTRLSSMSFLEGFYYKPRIDMEILKQHHEGVICLSACISGEINLLLIEDKDELARQRVLEYRELFGDDYYLEIQNHGLDREDKARSKMIELSRDLSIPLVATNDIHYIEKEHYLSHDVLLCMRDQHVHNPHDIQYNTDQLYFKSEEEMRRLFADTPEALDVTVDIAAKVDLELKFGEYHLPRFPIAADSKTTTIEDFFAERAHAGLHERFADITPLQLERLNYEIKVIQEMGFSAYMLIVQDFIHHAKRHSCRVGPGRGSAAGSLVAYAMGITDIDPLEYDLLFERFLNPERISMPDIDIDFDDLHRGEVYEYVKEKYGVDNVAQIITFNRMKPKAAIKAVARALGIPYGEANKVSKLYPDEAGSLQEGLKLNPEFRHAFEGEELNKSWLQHSLVLENFNSTIGKHAAGVVIAPTVLTDYLPLARSVEEDVLTQFDLNYIEEMGLLKMDFLGLTTLSIVEGTLERIRQHDADVDIDTIPKDDKKVYELFGRGETIGIFQFESSGMRENLKKLQPTSLEDLIAMNALYRPGPMDNIGTFIARKHGREPIEYAHYLLAPLLQNTYGVIVYQEQVMQVVSEIGGFSLGKADILRKAMGKKKVSIMDEMKPDFMTGAKEKGVEARTAEVIWQLIYKFSNYGFNKAHAAAYTWLAYQTAWLKVHYPAEYMAAVMSSSDDLENLALFRAEAQRLGIDIVYPDINKSTHTFDVRDKKIYYGLSAIKNVGKGGIEAITAEREQHGEFSDLLDMVSRIDLKKVPRRALECLIQAGALDCLPGHRSQMMLGLDDAIRYAEVLADEKRRNQISLFDEWEQQAGVVLKPVLPEIPEWLELEQLAREMEMLGFYVSGHPLMLYEDEVRFFSTVSLAQLSGVTDGTVVRLSGIVSELSRRVIKSRNKPMILFRLSDMTGGVKMRMFDEAIQQFQELVVDGSLLSVKGRLLNRDDDMIVTVEQVIPLEQVKEKLARRITIDMEDEPLPEELINKLETICLNCPGKTRLRFLMTARDDKRLTLQSEKYSLKVTNELIGEVKDLVFPRRVVLD